jgi:hypothetical protein
MALGSSTFRPTHSHHLFRWGGSRLVAPVAPFKLVGGVYPLGERQLGTTSPRPSPHLI